MNTVIIINLDYESFPIVKCKRVWDLIETGMCEAGFIKSNRLFIANVNSEIAFAKARSVLHDIENACLAEGEDVLHCVREFYGIPYSQIVDLALPSAREITVDFMAAGSFQKLFPAYSQALELT